MMSSTKAGLLACSLALTLCAAASPAMRGDCKCHKLEKDDKTRWGGNEAIVIAPEHHFREIKGTVETFQNQKMEDALVEVFDKPDYLVTNKPWAEKPEQNRLRSCVTSRDGKFCFRALPSGIYEVRVSKDQGWNVTHIYVVVDGKAAGKTEQLHVMMDIGK
jgi:hypothetical protein